MRRGARNIQEETRIEWKNLHLGKDRMWSTCPWESDPTLLVSILFKVITTLEKPFVYGRPGWTDRSFDFSGTIVFVERVVVATSRIGLLGGYGSSLKAADNG